MLNKATIIGYLGGDPETRYSQVSNAITNFSIATTEKWTDKNTGERKEKTEWHRCVCFGRIAEIAGEYLKKGRPVYIEGKITTSKYTDKEGIERYSTQINVNRLILLPSRDGGGERQQRSDESGSSSQRSQHQESFEDDPIPF
jgi:single-strand DNA-binding protein